MNTNVRIRNGILVLPHETVRGSIVIESGKIAAVDTASAPDKFRSASADAVEIDAEGMYVFPGFVDIHGDAIEKEVQPRPNSLFPLDSALYEMEKKLAACGITTMYHSLSLGVGLSIRGVELVTRMLDLIRRYRCERTMIRHRTHLRYEVLYAELIETAESLIESGTVDYFSYMLHAPGVGQYKREGSFVAYVMKNQGVNREEATAIADDVVRMSQAIDWARIERLCEAARAKGVAVASHDDDSIELVDRTARFGASVVEFPLNLETAAYAASRKLHVCVGAPNIVRGGSHDANLRAIDAVLADAADIVCSDYYPPSMLLAVFRLADAGIPLHRAAAMASLHPARAVGIDRDFGSIEVGKFADLLLVEDRNGYPNLRKTIVGGVPVYESGFIRDV